MNYYFKTSNKENFRPRWLHWWILQNILKENKLILHRLFPKVKEERILSNSNNETILPWYKSQGKKKNIYIYSNDHSYHFESDSESGSVMSDSLKPQDYTVHGILQARILEWVALPCCRRSSQPRDQTQVSRIAGRFFTSWATREAHFNSVIKWRCWPGQPRKNK